MTAAEPAATDVTTGRDPAGSLDGAACGPLLEATEISKRFGGIGALDAVSLTVGRGQAVGLVGPNGAGKTTLFNCLSGLLAPDSGRVRFAGRDLRGLSAHRRARLGIGRTFQRLELFAELSVREHLLVAERVRRGDGALWKDLINRGGPRPEERQRVAEVIELVGLGPVADRAVESVTLGYGRLVELGRALMTEPELLLLDEPSSGLDQTESLGLADVLDQVQRERDTAILLVEHDLAMVRRIATRLFVLDLGRMIATGPQDEVLAEPAVRRAYLGEEAGG